MSGPRERDYQPCSHECNGCPTCDPGLRPTADTGPSERDEIAADREALAEVLRRADDAALVRTNFGQLVAAFVAAYDESADAVLASDWLAERDRRTAAKALREAAEQARSDCDDAGDDDPCSCRFVAGWLDTRADRIERGE